MFSSEVSGFFGECHLNPICPGIRQLGESHYGVPAACEQEMFQTGMVIFYEEEELVAENTDDVYGMTLYETKYQDAFAQLSNTLGLQATSAELNLESDLSVPSLLRSILGIDASVEGT
jgi:hypothetical protein